MYSHNWMNSVTDTLWYNQGTGERIYLGRIVELTSPILTAVMVPVVSTFAPELLDPACIGPDDARTDLRGRMAVR